MSGSLPDRVREAVRSHTAEASPGGDLAVVTAARARRVRRVRQIGAHLGTAAAVLAVVWAVGVLPTMLPSHQTAVPAHSPSASDAPDPAASPTAIWTPLPPADPMPSASPTAPVGVEPIAPSAVPAIPITAEADSALGQAFARFAMAPQDTPLQVWSPLPRVLLGVGQHFLTEESAEALRSPDAWRIGGPDVHLGERIGPYNAVDVLGDHLGRHGHHSEAIVVGPGSYLGCPDGTTTRPPDSVADLHRVTLQPAEGTVDSCRSWFSVDLYVTEQYEVRAVVLNQGQP